MSFSEPLVCSGISGWSSTFSNAALLACSRRSRRSSVAKPVRRTKMRSKRACSSLRGRCGPVGLEVGVEPPDQATHLLGGALLVGEGLQLMHQPLGMDPAEGMVTDVELASVVTDDHRLVEEAMRGHRPHSAPSVATRTGSGVT